MSGVENTNDDIVASINVTPLVDIMLVLLVVFMVTAKLADANGIPLDLPRAASGGAVQTVFTVSIAPDSEVIIDGARVNGDEELRASARNAILRTPDLRTVLRASSAAPYGVVLHVMDQLRESGIDKIAFATEPKPSTPDR